MTYEKLTIKPKTKERLHNEFLNDYLKHHPEMKHTFISEDKMVNDLIDYWLQ